MQFNAYIYCQATCLAYALRGDTVAPPLKIARMQLADVLVHSKRTAFQKAADSLKLGILAMYSSQAVFMRRWTVR